MLYLLDGVGADLVIEGFKLIDTIEDIASLKGDQAGEVALREVNAQDGEVLCVLGFLPG